MPVHNADITAIFEEIAELVCSRGGRYAAALGIDLAKDSGNEDSVLKDALYREVMGVFLKRLEARKRGAAR